MNVHDVIAKKRTGLALTAEEVSFCIRGFLSGGIDDCQMAALLMAVCIRGMTFEETVSLTREMIRSGSILRFNGLPGPLIDKHSTGGIGDKVSLVLLPVAVECGICVPMVSGRALGFTGGTLDKLESIPGMRTDLSGDRIVRQVRDLGGCFAAQTEEMVPADRRLYALRDSTATVESIPLIVSSILSKKCAEGVSGVVIDVKCGRGAFMDGMDGAGELARALESVGAEIGVPVKTVITSMDEPIGRAVGNAIEVAEVMETLRGSGSADCLAVTYRLVAEMLRMGDLASSIDEGERRAAGAIDSGRAFERFVRIVGAQGGKLEPDRPEYGLPQARVKREVTSPGGGFIAGIDARRVGDVVRDLGGGRKRPGDAVDHSVGVLFRRKKGDAVSRGEPVCLVHAASENAAARAARSIADAIVVDSEPPQATPLFPVRNA